MDTVFKKGINPEQALAYWKNKILLTDREAEKLHEEARQQAFYISSLAKLDQIKTVHAALQEALEQGEPLKDFKEKIANIIAEKGWHAHRIETIFQTNMHSAYQAGRWAGMQKTKETRPYLQYSAVLDKRTRPSHAVLHGLIYPCDHEFWNTFYPPNGYRCRCTVRSVSKNEVKRNKLTVETQMPHNRFFTDPKTGAELFVNQPLPDKGFFNNVGKNWQKAMEAPLFDKLEETDPKLAKEFISHCMKKDFARWRKNPHTDFPVAILKPEQSKRFETQKSIVRLSKDTIVKQDDHHPELTLEHYLKIQEAVSKSEMYRQNENSYAFILEEKDGIVCIIKVTKEKDKLYLTSMRRLSNDAIKKEETIQKIKRGRQTKQKGEW